MSEDSMYKVPLTQILNIQPHFNADSLEVATVYGFQVIVKKGHYKPGDMVVYIPVDSILPQWLEDRLFPHTKNADGKMVPPKVKLNNGRVRQIRLRGLASQGMLVNTHDVADKVNFKKAHNEGNLAEELGITKYEPPTPKFQRPSGGPKLRNKPHTNPYFRAYNGIANIKWLPNMFKDEEVVIQCKLHGSHIRWGKAPFAANTLWKKVKKVFGLTPKFESVYGSNNVELTNKTDYQGYYGGDVYGAALARLGAFDKTKDGEFWHGELIGPGIQKGYTYGHAEHHVVVFDVRVVQPDGTQKWLNPEEAEALAKERGFDFVPVLYKGPFSADKVEECTSGPSVYDPKEKIREGCVVKSRLKYDDGQNKRSAKCINPDYLDGDHGDNH